MNQVNKELIFAKFKEHLSSKSASTQKAYLADIKQILGESDLILEANFFQQRWEDFKSGVYYSEKTIFRKSNAFRRFLKFLYYQKLIKSNIYKLIKVKVSSSVKLNFLTRQEYSLLRDAVRGKLPEELILELSLQLGLKINEISKLKWDDISNLQGDFFLTLKNRKLKLTSKIELLLNKAENKNGYVIKKLNKPISARKIRQIFDFLYKNTGIRNRTFNDIRNTFIFEQLRQGLKVKKVMELAGHKNISTTEEFLKKVPEYKETSLKNMVEI